MGIHVYDSPDVILSVGGDPPGSPRIMSTQRRDQAAGSRAGDGPGPRRALRAALIPSIGRLGSNTGGDVAWYLATAIQPLIVLPGYLTIIDSS
jgi:hypothetical protein